MLAKIGYSTVVLQTGAAMLQVVVPSSGDRTTDWQGGEVVEAGRVWSDTSYQFNIVTPKVAPVEITESQSQALHEAFLASLDDFIAPILIG